MTEVFLPGEVARDGRSPPALPLGTRALKPRNSSFGGAEGRLLGWDPGDRALGPFPGSEGVARNKAKAFEGVGRGEAVLAWPQGPPRAEAPWRPGSSSHPAPSVAGPAAHPLNRTLRPLPRMKPAGSVNDVALDAFDLDRMKQVSVSFPERP